MHKITFDKDPKGMNERTKRAKAWAVGLKSKRTYPFSAPEIHSQEKPRVEKNNSLLQSENTNSIPTTPQSFSISSIDPDDSVSQTGGGSEFSCCKRVRELRNSNVQTISDLFGIDLANEFIRIITDYLGEKQTFLQNANSPPYYDFVETFLGEPKMKKFTCIWTSGEVVERAFYELYCLINHHE